MDEFYKRLGQLVGELNHGLSNMFTMMNYERLSMARRATGWQAVIPTAADYAWERIQGRSLIGPQQLKSAADPILVHPEETDAADYAGEYHGRSRAVYVRGDAARHFPFSF